MTIQKLLSGLIAGAAAAVIFGVIIGMVTYFFGFLPGAVIGYGVGFRWGCKRVDDGADLNAGSAGTLVTSGDTAFLVGGFFGTLWATFAGSDFFFGYSGPYRGHPLGIISLCLGLMLSPIAALFIEAQAHCATGIAKTRRHRHWLAAGIAAGGDGLVALGRSARSTFCRQSPNVGTMTAPINNLSTRARRQNRHVVEKIRQGS